MNRKVIVIRQRDDGQTSTVVFADNIVTRIGETSEVFETAKGSILEVADDVQVAGMEGLVSPWKTATVFKAGDPLVYKTNLYRVEKDHTSLAENVANPTNRPDWYRRLYVYDGYSYPAWKGGVNHSTGDRVWHVEHYWVSKKDNNYSEPGKNGDWEQGE